MKKKIFSILLSLAMVVTMMLAMASVSFAGEANTTVPVELVKATTSGSRAINLSWNKVSDATEYVVYGQKCGKKYMKLTTTAKTSYKVLKIKKTKLKAHKTYKFYVVAYKGDKKLVTSNSIHFITGKTMGKYANAKSIKVSPTSMTLEPGQTAKLKTTTEIYKNKKHIKANHGAATRYAPDNPTVATVNSMGVVNAKKEGTATIYVQDIGGLWCKTTITVKKPKLPALTKYTVTFDMQGHGTYIDSLSNVVFGSRIDAPTVPTADGYVFEGWYKEESCTNQWNFDTDTVTADTTLYAKWIPGPFGFSARVACSKVALTKNGSPTDIDFEYSTDASNWQDYTVGTEITLSAIGDKAYFRAKTASSTGSLNTDSSNGYRFTTSEGKVDVFGNIMYLVDKEGKPNVSNNTFEYLFTNCSNLESAENLILPAMNLAEYCYANMFSGCTSLTTAPILPSESLAAFCYNSMFYGCSVLTEAPELPATIMAESCYGSMFYNCTSLTTAPILSSESLATSCYNRMFYGCSALTEAPELPAQTMAGWCYKYMFYGCSALAEAPELPAQTMAEYCYEGMFYNCTSLTTAPELPATTLVSWCYFQMFLGCTNLNSVTVGFTDWGIQETKEWLQGVAANGTFNCPSGLLNETGDSRIPTGWTVLRTD